MNIPEIKELAITSSDTYYKYLADCKPPKGRSEINVFSIENVSQNECIFKLKISSKIFDLDAIVFSIPSTKKEYTTMDVKIVEYDYDTNTLLIKPIATISHEFEVLPSFGLVIISDLKFLIKRVRDWFESNGSSVQIPTLISSISENYSSFTYGSLLPSIEQEDAIKCIFSNPFSYIWGAPGTGKTQFVLAYSIIQYIKAGKKVAIFAPTNNSLEQVLYGVLKMTQEAGIKNDKILRLGTPSKKFAKDYAEVCEVKGISKKIEEIDNQIKIFMTIINSKKEQNNLIEISKNLNDLNRIDVLISRRNIIESDIKLTDRNINSKENSIDLEQSYCNDSRKEIKILESKMNSFFYKLSKIFSDSYKEIESKLSIEREKLKKGIESIEILNGELLDFKKLQLKNKLGQDSINAEINIVLNKVRKICSQHADLKAISNTINNVNYKERKKLLLDKISQLQNEIPTLIADALASEYIKYDENRLIDKIKSYEQLKKDLEQQSTEKRIESCNVIAATLDTYIGRYIEKELPISHIFLDEAGYACMIKALVLFRSNIPVTFLGDHKQLPPVCELNDSEFNNPEHIEYKDVFIWAQSSIYLESLFSKTKNELFGAYINNQEIIFQRTAKNDLKRTHRFGNSLAHVLNQFVYMNGFGSNMVNGQTEIFFINVPHFFPQPLHEGRVMRENIHEACAIRDLVQNQQVIDDFVILTPYTKQMRAIGTLLPKERNDHKILTVHGSQGREWDTVILSIVDTDKKFFTDSKNKTSRGINLINTAVSRAKNRLIIVCNTNYWTTQPNQLIKGILEQAKNFKI